MSDVSPSPPSLTHPITRSVRAEQEAFFNRQRRRIQLRYIALILPLLCYLGVFYVYPVAAMLFRSFGENEFTLEHYLRLFESPAYLRVLWYTFRVAAITTAITLVLGYPVAYVLATASRGRTNLMLALVLVPFWTSILVRSYAWMVLLGREGLINRLLTWASITDGPIKLLNTTFAVYIGMVHILLPFMVLPLFSVLRGINPDLVRAAEGLGASSLRTFRHVVLPLSLPGITAGSLLVFIISLGFYITPALIGGQRDMTIAMLIGNQVELYNWHFAASLATILLVLALTIFVIFDRIMGVEQLFRGARQ